MEKKIKKYVMPEYAMIDCMYHTTNGISRYKRRDVVRVTLNKTFSRHKYQRKTALFVVTNTKYYDKCESKHFMLALIPKTKQFDFKYKDLFFVVPKFRLEATYDAFFTENKRAVSGWRKKNVKIEMVKKFKPLSKARVMRSF